MSAFGDLYEAAARNLAAADGAAVSDDPSSIVWSDDVEVAVEVGDLIRGSLEVVVERPENVRAWLDGLKRQEIEDIWNRELADTGEETRVQVVGFRATRSFLTGSASTYGVEFEVIARVAHNGLLLWIVFAAIVAAFASAAYLLGGQQIVSATGKATGSFAGGVVGGFVDALPAPVQLTLAAAVLLGVYLWLR